jgi:Tfp pilus assembly ATPase PilU
MDQCLRDLYLKGWITLEEALMRCQNQDELKKMINTHLSGATRRRSRRAKRGR